MKKILSFSILLILILTGCKKLIQIDPPLNQLTSEAVFSDTATATAALVTGYSLINIGLDPNLTKVLAIYTDEAAYTSFSDVYLAFYRNQSQVLVDNPTVSGCWSALYQGIYRCNDVIAQLNKSATLPQDKVTAMVSEAKFLRAYFYFYLVNLWQNVPLILTTDVNQSVRAVQADPKETYNQIIADLKDAQEGLPETYIGPGKVRANKWAVTALLAKVYLFRKDYLNAFIQSSAVISSGLYTPLPAPEEVFQADSKETILSIATLYGYISDGFSLGSLNNGIPQYALTPGLLNSFEAGDARKSAWTQSSMVDTAIYYYDYKYRNNAASITGFENLMVLRAAEQYLIRADAQAAGAGNGISGAIDDLNVIRSRAGLSPYSGLTDSVSVSNAILKERRVELFMENGNRFLDLKRSGTINATLTAEKATWTPTSELWPIPKAEITVDRNLVQNPGYQ